MEDFWKTYGGKERSSDDGRQQSRATNADGGAKKQRESPDEKKKALFLQQKKTLDTFLGTGAITRAQYDKSLGDLIEKMGMQGVEST